MSGVAFGGAGGEGGLGEEGDDYGEEEEGAEPLGDNPFAALA